MKFKFRYLIILIICMLVNIKPAFAMNFNPEDLYNSVVVVYTDKGIGSGFAVDENTIITNAHVVDYFTTVSVKLYNNKLCSGKVIKNDKNIDLALIKVEEPLTPLTLRSEDSISIGEEVYAIGAPKDIPYTMTKGIISAKNRKIADYEYIQIDASINEGNSGGPLIDENGKVIGINTMKVMDAEGIGFVIGTSYIDDFVNDRQLENNITENKTQEDNLVKNDIDSNYKKLMKENENLKILVIILSLLLFIAIVIIFRMKLKRRSKSNNDFDIEIQDGNWMN